MRHGELCGLAREDIDLHAGTIICEKRNLTQTDEFTLPKPTRADRVIYLIQPAIDA